MAVLLVVLGLCLPKTMSGVQDQLDTQSIPDTSLISESC